MTEQLSNMKRHLSGLESELAYLLDNLGEYQRIQRKNVLEYLNRRIDMLKIDCNNISSAKKVLEKKETVVAKKKMEKQRYEMKMFLNMTYGPNAWNDVLKMEGDIRKRRQKEIYDRQELIRKIWDGVGWVLLFCTLVGFVFFLAWLWKEKRGA